MAAADLTTYRAVHTALRAAPHRLARAAASVVVADDRTRAEAIARYWKGYAGEVHAHHTVEDEFLFPALVERVPVAAALVARTDADHSALDALVAECDAAVTELVRVGDGSTAADAFGRLAHLMDDHLDLEDADVLPLFERHFTAEEYAVLDERAQKSLGLGAQAAFTVPFVASSLDADELAAVLDRVPFAFRLLLRLTRRRHARLAVRAFGPEVTVRS